MNLTGSAFVRYDPAMKPKEIFARIAAPVAIATAISACSVEASIPNQTPHALLPLIGIGAEATSQNHSHHIKLHWYATISGLEVHSLSAGADTTPGFPIQAWIGTNDRDPNGITTFGDCGNGGHPDTWNCSSGTIK